MAAPIARFGTSKYGNEMDKILNTNNFADLRRLLSENFFLSAGDGRRAPSNGSCLATSPHHTFGHSFSCLQGSCHTETTKAIRASYSSRSPERSCRGLHISTVSAGDVHYLYTGCTAQSTQGNTCGSVLWTFVRIDRM